MDFNKFYQMPAVELLDTVKDEVIPQFNKAKVSTQLYKILETLRQLRREFDRSGFNLDSVQGLRIKLAWAAQKQHGRGGEPLRNFLVDLESFVRNIRNEAGFDKLEMLVEAVVAYNGLDNKMANSYREEGQDG